MFAVLHVADFPLQAVLRFERELAARAVVLCDETRQPPLVIACTAAARAAGVEAGQTVPQAMARCAKVELRTAQPAAEAEARAGLLAAALAVSPHVEDTAAGVCTINVAGVAEEERERALAAAVEQLEKLGLSATAGMAATPWLALMAARVGVREFEGGARPLGAPEGRKGGEGDFGEPGAPALPALVRRGGDAGGEASLFGAGSREGLPDAARSPRPTGEPRCVSLRRGAEREFLRDLPLAVAEPTAEIAEILAAWGVRTLGELTALTKADVTLRLGPAGLALWERAAGEVVRPLRVVTPPQTFMAEIALEQEVETLEPLLFVLRRFIDRLALELRNAGFVAGEMKLGLMLADDTAYTRAFRLPEPTAREEILFRVLHTHLESLHTAAAVRGLSLNCQPVRPLARQQGIFESALRDPHGFAETLARVSAVVGAENVGTPTLDDTHRPDAVTLVKPATIVPPVGENGYAGTAVHPARGLALRRYRPPLAATVELNGTAPAFVWTAAVRGAVIAQAGPWRGSGEWWEEARFWRSDEWDVELENGGGVYRLRQASEGWFLEGEYD